MKKLYNYYFSSEKDLARRMKSILGFTPSNLQLFKRAFYHKSMNNIDNVHLKSNNERLEYLGDAILSTIVAEYLFKKYPNQNEGFLTKMRSKIVKRKTLNSIGDKMGLDVILSQYMSGKMSHSMLGNALEALVGALYLELGYTRTRDYFISNILMRYLDIHELETTDDNYKSKLLEWCQKHDKNIDFKLLKKYKFDKRDRYHVAVMVEGKEISTAEDFNKKAAEQHASSSAIKQLNIES